MGTSSRHPVYGLFKSANEKDSDDDLFADLGGAEAVDVLRTWGSRTTLAQLEAAAADIKATSKSLPIATVTC